MSAKSPSKPLDRHTRAFQKHGDFFRPFVFRAVKNIEVVGIENFNTVADGHVMVVCPHRSHMDYIVGGLELSDQGITRLRFAAGDNLTRIPWFGKKIREMGAFSVYRGKASQRSYLFKLTEQVRKLILDDNKVIVYPEGGRSYSGRMLDIRTGITGAAVMAQHADVTTPVYYLPMTMSYDFLPEVPYYPLLLKGKNMRDRGRTGLVRLWGTFLYYWADALSFIKLMFNRHVDSVKIIVDAPVKVTDIADVEGTYRKGARNEFLANRTAIEECAQYISQRFLEMFPISPQHLVAEILDQGLQVTPAQIASMLTALAGKGGNLSLVATELPEVIVEKGLATLKRHKAIRGTKKIIIKNQATLSYFSGAVKDLMERES